jgi:hypothetical protein
MSNRGQLSRDLRASTFSIAKLQEKLTKPLAPKETDGLAGSDSGESESTCLIGTLDCLCFIECNVLESLTAEQLEIITQYTNSSLYGEEIKVSFFPSF